MAPRFPAQVVVRDVSRTYGRAFALHRISLTLEAGCITAIIGNNGAGKSTLLNLLATIDQPTRGQIHYGEVPFQRFAQNARHRVGWVSHQALLYEELTARENLVFFGRMYGINAPDDRAQSWLERVGLADDADRRVQAFSRGMKQRLSLARALIHSPQLILFDEPATGLDQGGNQFVLDLLDELRHQQCIVVVVTHDFDLLDAIADRVVILRRGKISFQGPIDDGAPTAETYQAHA